MISFRQFILEKFVKASGNKYKPLFGVDIKGYEIFENPSRSELKDLEEKWGTVLRFIFDYKKKKGYFILPYEGGGSMIHEDMMDILKREKLIKYSGPTVEHWDVERVRKDGFIGLVYKKGKIGWSESYGNAPVISWPEDLKVQIYDAIDKVFHTMPERMQY